MKLSDHAQGAHSLHHLHQFESAEQQYESATLGMWAFIVQEILFFGGLFCAYTVYRNTYIEAFTAGSYRLDIFWGTLNTVVLIASSLTMAMAVRSAQTNSGPGRIIGWLIATIILGCTFLGVKAIEYTGKWHHHLIPNSTFQWNDPAFPTVTLGPAKIFYSFYFVMTGMHALHMIIGVGIMLWMIAKVRRNEISAQYFTPIEISGLYWHFVDIVWIFLFPLLYLIGRHH
jgi:cytochrome c oxidase subunit 3